MTDETVDAAFQKAGLAYLDLWDERNTEGLAHLRRHYGDISGSIYRDLNGAIVSDEVRDVALNQNEATFRNAYGAMLEMHAEGLAVTKESLQARLEQQGLSGVVVRDVEDDFLHIETAIPSNLMARSALINLRDKVEGQDYLTLVRDAGGDYETPSKMYPIASPSDMPATDIQQIMGGVDRDHPGMVCIYGAYPGADAPPFPARDESLLKDDKERKANEDSILFWNENGFVATADQLEKTIKTMEAALPRVTDQNKIDDWKDKITQAKTVIERLRTPEAAPESAIDTTLPLVASSLQSASMERDVRGF